MTNAEIAKNFLELAANGNVDEAYEKYVSPDFQHHNAYFPGDRESLKNGMKDSYKNNPNKKLTIHQILVDGDKVAVHSHLSQSPDLEIAVVHIVRIQQNKIVEMWDVGQVIPANSPNQNSPF
ncbi:nuclear transport factor 2 family protein [Candidatus Peregrinibacteria bacterium]|nr:nuclear transport factor 2 family protein [Candidatus Peregrinibacteria bacterium]